MLSRPNQIPKNKADRPWRGDRALDRAKALAKALGTWRRGQPISIGRGEVCPGTLGELAGAIAHSESDKLAA